MVRFIFVKLNIYIYNNIILINLHLYVIDYHRFYLFFIFFKVRTPNKKIIFLINMYTATLE